MFGFPYRIDIRLMAAGSHVVGPIAAPQTVYHYIITGAETVAKGETKLSKHGHNT